MPVSATSMTTVFAPSCVARKLTVSLGVNLVVLGGRLNRMRDSAALLHCGVMGAVR